MLTAKSVINQGELDYISKCVLDFPDIETGGDLFGFWTYSGFPVIQYVIGPGPKSNHQVAFFNQDIEYLDTVGRALRKKFGLQHIGEWHSHHRLGLAHPSGHDSNTVKRAIDSYNLKQFFLVIANIYEQSTGINGFMYFKGNISYDQSKWVILESESPMRLKFDNEYPHLVYQPKTQIANQNGLAVTTLDEPVYKKAEYKPDYWLNYTSNHQELKIIIDSLSEKFENVKLLQNEDKTVYIQMFLNAEEYHLEFNSNFPLEKPRLIRSDKQCSIENEHINWEFNKSVSEATISLVSDLLLI